MYIKNLTTSSLTLSNLGVTLLDSEIRELSEFASREFLQLNSKEIIDLLYQDKVDLQDSDGSILDKSTAVQYILNAYSIVKLDPASIMELKTSQNQFFYFLKDSYRLRSNDTIEKTFKGYLKTFEIISNHDDLDIKFITGAGLELPIDHLEKREKLEIDFDGDIKDPTIIIKARKNTNVELYLDGWCSDDTPKNIQRFINTWYSDIQEWKTSKPIIVKKIINKKEWEDYSIIEHDSVGHKLMIPANRTYTTNDYFRIYKVTGKEYIIQYLEGNRWTVWNPNSFYIKLKNFKHVQFNDVTIDLETDSSIVDYNEYYKDKEED